MSEPLYIDIKEMMHRAFVAGFETSAEGYNGEYPFDKDTGQIRRELHDEMAIEIERIVSSAICGQVGL